MGTTLYDIGSDKDMLCNLKLAFNQLRIRSLENGVIINVDKNDVSINSLKEKYYE